MLTCFPHLIHYGQFNNNQSKHKLSFSPRVVTCLMCTCTELKKQLNCLLLTFLLSIYPWADISSWIASSAHLQNLKPKSIINPHTRCSRVYAPDSSTYSAPEDSDNGFIPACQKRSTLWLTLYILAAMSGCLRALDGFSWK